MVYPLLPFYLTLRLGASPAVLGLIEGLAESLASLLKVVSGRVSDRLRRRKGLAVLGYASSGIGKVVFYFAGTWSGVLVGRLADRFGKGIRTAPRDALVAESAPEGRRGWAFGLHRSMDTFGAAVGAFLAYWLLLRLGGGNGFSGVTAGGFRPIFLVALIPAALGVAVLLWVKETGSGRAGEPVAEPQSGAAAPTPVSATTLWAVFGRLDPRLKTLLVVTGVFTLGNSSNQFLLLRVGQGIGPAGAVLAYAFFNVSYALFSWPAGWLSDRVGRQRVLIVGFLLYAVVYGGLAFGLGQGWAGAIILFLLYGVYSALTDGVAKAFVADFAPGELRATVIGLHSTIVGIGLFPASLLAGVLWSAFGPWAAFTLGAAAGLAAAVGLVCFPRRKRADRSSAPSKPEKPAFAA